MAAADRAAREALCDDIVTRTDAAEVQRVGKVLVLWRLYGSHFLPHDAMQTQKSGRTFLN